MADRFDPVNMQELRRLDVASENTAGATDFQEGAEPSAVKVKISDRRKHVSVLSIVYGMRKKERMT